MTRAERRRLQKKERKKEAVYNLTSEQLCSQIHKRAAEEFKDIYQQGREEGMRDALVLTLALPLEVLIKEYWQDDFREKLPDFVDSVLRLYEDWLNDEISIEDLRDDLWEYGGVKLQIKEEEGEQG